MDKVALSQNRSIDCIIDVDPEKLVSDFMAFP